MELKEVCRLLKRPFSKQRLLTTCFHSPPHVFFAGRIASFDSDVYEGRWNSVLHASADLLELANILVPAWSKDAYLLHQDPGRANRHDDEDANDSRGRGVQIKRVDNAIRSPWFWCCTLVSDFLGEILIHLTCWVESCPCHGAKLQCFGSSRLAGNERKRILHGGRRCPLFSMRAAEASAGDLLKFADRLFQMSTAVLRVHPLLAHPGISERERGHILQAFARGKRYILFALQVKISFFQQLPYCLMGLAHYDPAVARRIGRRCILLYEKASVKVREFWWVAILLTPGSSGRRLVEQWLARNPADPADGEIDFSHSNVLTRMVSRFMFVLLSERWVESRHAIANKYLGEARNAGVVHLGFTMMQPYLRMELVPPEALTLYAKLCSSVRNPLLILRASGLCWHPRIQEIVRKLGTKYGQMNKKHRKDLIRVIFHLDSYTLYRAAGHVDSSCPPPAPPGFPDLPELAQEGGQEPSSPVPLTPPPLPPPDSPPPPNTPPASHVPEPPRDESDHDAPPEDPGAHGPVQPRDVPTCQVYNALWCKHLMLYLQALDKEQRDAGPGNEFIFSVGPRSHGRVGIFESLASLVNPGVEDTEEDQAATFDIHDDTKGDVVVEGPEELYVDERAAACGVIFFSIVEGNPAGMEVAQYAPKVSRSLSIAVAPLPLFKVTRKPYFVSVGLENTDATAEMDFQILCTDNFKREDLSKCYVWQSTLGRSDGIQYDFGIKWPRELGDDQVWQRLCSALASASKDKPHLQASNTGSERKAQALLEWLAARGIVAKQQESPVDAYWHLTPLGYSKLHLAQRLRRPKRIVEFVLNRVLEQKTSYIDMEAFELLCFLEGDGWSAVWKAKGQRTKRKLGEDDDQMLVPVDYRPGGAKLFWVRLQDRTVSAWYLRALVTADKRPDSVVRHFMSSFQYEELVTGKQAKSRRRRRRRGKPLFHVFDADKEIPEAETVIEFEEAKGGPDEDYDSDQSGAMSECSGRGSDSSSKSSSPPSSVASAKSGLTDSSSSTPASVEYEPSEPGAKSEDDLMASDKGGSGDEKSKVEGRDTHAGAQLQDNFTWKGFLFTGTFDTSLDENGDSLRTLVGYQCSCCILKHKGKPVCQRTRRFAKFGGRDNLLMMLKQWCHDGFDEHIVGLRDVHPTVPDKPKLEDRLADDVLEAWEPPSDLLDTIAIYRNKRRLDVTAAGPKKRAK